MKVSKEEFDKFIENYKGPGELCKKEINFTTPSSTIYCDFERHPDMIPGIPKIIACTVAEHIHSTGYINNPRDEYHIFIED